MVLPMRELELANTDDSSGAPTTTSTCSRERQNRAASDKCGVDSDKDGNFTFSRQIRGVDLTETSYHAN